MNFLDNIFAEINRGIDRFKDDPTGGFTSLNKKIGLKGLTGQRALEEATAAQQAQAEQERLLAQEQLNAQRIQEAQKVSNVPRVKLGTASKKNVGVSSSLGLVKGDTGVQI